MTQNRPETKAITGDHIKQAFNFILDWCDGGSLYIITPFINDLDIGRRNLIGRLNRQARSSTSIRLMVAPPDRPCKNGKHKTVDSMLRCKECRGAASKINTLDKYLQFSEDIFVKDQLHGKVYLAWNRRNQLICLTGSINLTRQALDKYWEIGVYTFDNKLTNMIEKIVTRWEGPDRKRGGRAQLYVPWKRDFFRRYPNILDLMKRL